MIGFDLAIAIVGVAFAAAAVGITTIRSRKKGEICDLHNIVVSDMERRNEELWEAVKEIRIDIKSLLRIAGRIEK